MLHQLRRAVRRATRPAVPVQSGVEQGQSFYDHRYATKAHKRLPYHLSHYYPLWSVIADRVRDRAGVLEVGCGAGQLATLLRDQGLTRYVGFDLSPEAIAIARTMIPEGNFLVANAFETDVFATATYDTLLCTEVLEHITDDLDLIRRWPSGVRCICSVPDFPGKAHVRHFDNAAEVIARYGELFGDLRVTTHIRASERPGRFFLLDGVRR
jgi:SAM-dependent methyltransferase